MRTPTSGRYLGPLIQHYVLTVRLRIPARVVVRQDHRRLEIGLLRVVAGELDRARQPGELEQILAQLDDIAELPRLTEESLHRLAADTAPGEQLLTELGQRRDAVLDEAHEGRDNGHIHETDPHEHTWKTDSPVRPDQSFSAD